MQTYLSLACICLLLLVGASVALAVMPPEVYIEQIENSKIRATIEVKSVEVIETTPARIKKKVVCKIIKSLGETDPGAEVTAFCYSVGKEPMVGGTIYYNPKPGQKAYITLTKADTEFTSFTPLTDELEDALLNDPSRVQPGMGVVNLIPKKTDEAEPRVATDCPGAPTIEDTDENESDDAPKKNEKE